MATPADASSLLLGKVWPNTPTPTSPQRPPKPTGVSSVGEAKLCTAMIVLADSGADWAHAEEPAITNIPVSPNR